MTNWTDLIDTDPVAAAKAWIKEEKPPDDIPDIVRGTQRTRWQTELKTARLIDNLAALAEALAKRNSYQERGHGLAWEEMIEQAMKDCRYPDGTPRFPKVK